MPTLPPTYLYYQSQIFYTNLIAFELFSAPYNDLAVTTYISFLNPLIDNAEDVKELRSKRILIDNLGSDEEVLKMFKEIATYSTENTEIYQVVRDGIEKQYESKMKTWMAEIIHKYFTNPWAAIGLIIATSVIVLSFVQTSLPTLPSSPSKMNTRHC